MDLVGDCSVGEVRKETDVVHSGSCHIPHGILKLGKFQVEFAGRISALVSRQNLLEVTQRFKETTRVGLTVGCGWNCRYL